VADQRHSATVSRRTLARRPARPDRPGNQGTFLSAAQEALSNIDQHAHASRIRLTLEVAPNGSNSLCGTTAPGSIPPRWPPPRPDRGRTWTAVHPEQAAAVGGKVILESGPLGTKLMFPRLLTFRIRPWARKTDGPITPRDCRFGRRSCHRSRGIRRPLRGTGHAGSGAMRGWPISARDGQTFSPISPSSTCICRDWMELKSCASCEPEVAPPSSSSSPSAERRTPSVGPCAPARTLTVEGWSGLATCGCSHLRRRGRHLHFSLLRGAGLFTEPQERRPAIRWLRSAPRRRGHSRSRPVLRSAALVLLVQSPLALLDVSFQLSFASVIALGFFAQRLRLERRPRAPGEYATGAGWLGRCLAASTVASLSTCLGGAPLRQVTPAACGHLALVRWWSWRFCLVGWWVRCWLCSIGAWGCAALDRGPGVASSALWGRGISSFRAVILVRYPPVRECGPGGKRGLSSLRSVTRHRWRGRCCCRPCWPARWHRQPGGARLASQVADEMRVTLSM